ncbi:MAG: hypothetical protein JW963_06290 [Anaerolineales bacterium]|nr:hypothetical protein [Anaerolineales bacterium]
MTKLISLLLVFGIALSACAGTSVSTTEPEPLGTPGSSATACNTPADWTIQYSRSGGFAGFKQSLTLHSDGSLTIQSENPPANVQKSISKEQVSEMANLLAQACPFKMQPNDAGCADCFIYNLSVQMNGQTYVMLATDVTLTDKLHPLIDVLSQLLQDTGG